MKIICKLFTIFSFFLFEIGQVDAAHIIGGEITYVCRGDGKYDFTMRIYRDCAGGGACFDSDPLCDNDNSGLPGHLTVFEGGRLFGTLNLSAPVITDIEPNLSNPCLIPPSNVCVEEGVYNFTLDLPYNADEITISYQRCCRNNSITNIRNPGATGATYTITLNPLSRDSCNSSPTFNDFPPIVICQGVDINFDHSATDPDGDSLVYSFCTPYLGGGNDQSQLGRFGPNGITPDPETPPPYESVNFQPGYRALQPLNISTDRDEPAISIDPETGLISGFPGFIGQYVVGVCVQAFKDGVLVNEVRRDFQFNVADCENSLNADVLETELRQKDGKDLYYIRICGEDQIINESTNSAYIDDLIWEFDLPGGATIRTDEWDTGILPWPRIDEYPGILILNPGFPECTDTALLLVDIYPELVADYEFDFDTCRNDPVQFTNLSVSGAGPEAIIEYIWHVDTLSTFNQREINYQFPFSDHFDVTLTVRDSNECVENITQEIPYFPLPEVLLITPSSETACVPGSVTFDKPAEEITQEYDLKWDFGDGQVSTDLMPSHLYEDVGVFDIGLSVTTPFGCHRDTLFPGIITTTPRPIADFIFSPTRISSLSPEVTFTDQSLDAVNWDWVFDGFFNSRMQNPIYSFPESGEKIVELVVTAANGCQDTTFRELIVEPDIAYTLPNAFTPNGDGVNDFYHGVGNAEDSEAFQFSIWNRYGELVFETTDANEKWNGRKNNQGKDVPNGVYIALVKYVDFRGDTFTLKEFVTVIR